MNIEEKDLILNKIKKERYLNINLSDYNYDKDIIKAMCVYQKQYYGVEELKARNLLDAKFTKELIEVSVNVFPLVNKKFLTKTHFLNILDERPTFFSGFTNEMKANKEVALKAISKLASNISYVDKKIINDVDIVKAILNKDIIYIGKLDKNIFMNKEVRDLVKSIGLLDWVKDYANPYYIVFKMYEHEEDLVNKMDNVEKNDNHNKKRKKI